jgi:hypothetical protein
VAGPSACEARRRRVVLPVSFLIWTLSDPKESSAKLADVNPTIPARVQARSRADRRLQSMTLGAAALGIAATGAFGYAAALTYTGKTTTVNAADGQTNLGDQQYAAPDTTGGSSNRSGTTSGGSTVNPNAGTQQQPVNPPATTKHRQHAVSGGS